MEKQHNFGGLLEFGKSRRDLFANICDQSLALVLEATILAQIWEEQARYVLGFRDIRFLGMLLLFLILIDPVFRRPWGTYLGV